MVAFSSRSPTTAQRSVHFLVLRRSVDWLNRMLALDGTSLSPDSAWNSFVIATAAPPLSLNADLVDLPATAATCDPANLIGQELAAALDQSDLVCPSSPTGHGVHSVPARGRTEYVKLIARELQLGKLVLLPYASGIGTVFAVPKSDGRQRAVWHGTLVSEASARPLRPRRLGNPAALLGLDWPAGTRVCWSKRDAASFFDTLLCPESFQPWFGRPPVSVSELLQAGLPMSEVC